MEKLGVLRILTTQFCLVVICDSAKIMMVPANFNSHFLYFARLGEGLASLGNMVEMFAPSNGHVPSHLANENFTITKYDVTEETPFGNTREISEAMTKLAMSEWKLLEMIKARSEMKKLSNSILSDCVAFMGNKKLMDRIRREQFQFAIMDPVAPECYYMLPHSLGIKYATFSILGKGWGYRLNRPSAMAVDETSFSDRLTTFILEFGMELMMSSRSDNSGSESPKDRLPSAPFDLVTNSSLWLILEQFVLNGAKPNLPNTISVGDIMAGQPVKPLPAELNNFLSHSPDGVIVFSFGSLFDFAAETVSPSFCEAFRRLKYRVIWKLKNASLCENAENVKILPWIPQNDLLAHEKVRLLITHGGFSSMLEAVYHAKPVIVFPLGSDQPGHAYFAVKRGFGLRMSLSDIKPDELVKNINRIFEEPSFAKQALLNSAILKDRLNKPAEEVSFLINHVIKHGDQHLRTESFQLSILEFLQFDIFCFLSLVIVVVLIITISCLFQLFRIGKKVFISAKNKLD